MKEIEQKLLNSASGSHWQKMGIKHHHGIAIPLFSLISEKSTGIGEFPDLALLIDFCEKIGFDVIQLLPLNDTGLDTSPYNALSAYALNPIHIGILSLPNVEKIPQFAEKIQILKKYNNTPRVKYDPVRELKKEFLHDYFSLVYADVSKTPEFEAFCKENPWLEPYALFKALKEGHGFLSWEEWPPFEKNPSPSQFASLKENFKEEIAFHIFMQFLCFQQFESIKTYAQKKGILIKGDIPILISKNSAEVWHQKELFFIDLSAGAPPDAYSAVGQDWGFPIYNWETIVKQGYAFWKQRLRVAEKLYHMYRIDHVVGFFRIWSVPKGKLPLDGHFIPSDENLWIPQGKKLMEMMLSSSTMLPIGEDLGTVPPSARQCLRDLGIPGTRVVRWERDWNGDKNFIPYNSYIPESMTTVSTHDSDTLQQWWRHSPKEAQLFSKFKGWDYKPFLSPERHFEILKDSHHTSSLFHINLLPEYLALFPELTSPNINDERINLPGTILPTNWTYKLHAPLEKLLSHPFLTKTMKDLIS